MKQPTSVRGKGPAKSHRKSREELNQEARDRKRQKKRRGHTPGSRSTGGDGQNKKGAHGAQARDPRIGSKKPVQLGVVDAPVKKQQQPKSENKMLSPQAELDMLENDNRLDALLERLEQGETLSTDDQNWVNEKLDRIDELMQQLGLSYDDEDDEPEEAREDDLMRLLKGGN